MSGSKVYSVGGNFSSNYLKKLFKINSAIKELQQLIQPYFLQRMKSEYLAEALPPKHEYVLWTNLSALQRVMYEEYIQSEI